jgi:hypothetical protein
LTGDVETLSRSEDFGYPCIPVNHAANMQRISAAEKLHLFKGLVSLPNSSIAHQNAIIAAAAAAEPFRRASVGPHWQSQLTTTADGGLLQPIPAPRRNV